MRCNCKLAYIYTSSLVNLLICYGYTALDAKAMLHIWTKYNSLYTKDNFEVKCTGNHGNINYLGILKYSCNDGMLQATEGIRDEDFLKFSLETLSRF